MPEWRLEESRMQDEIGCPLTDRRIGQWRNRRSILISYIEEMKMKVWINAKRNMAMELAMKRKLNWPMKNLYWMTSMNSWTFLMKTKPTDSQSLMCGTATLTWRRLQTKIFQELQSNTRRTKRIGQIPWWESGKRIHLTVSIPYGFFLHQKERWETMTLPGLSILEWLDHQKCLSITIDLWNNGYIKRSKILFKVWHTMGL